MECVECLWSFLAFLLPSAAREAHASPALQDAGHQSAAVRQPRSLDIDIRTTGYDLRLETCRERQVSVDALIRSPAAVVLVQDMLSLS